MAKRKSSRSKARIQALAPQTEAEGPTSPSEPARRRGPSPAAIRETVESVVVAFVLAFLFRTFEAEAFVIPTGSMAPTLMGRHKDLECDKCGYAFQVSASDEVNQNGASKGSSYWVDGWTCPMCRHTVSVTTGNPHDEFPSFKGDRILVGKFSYQFSDPERWDVAVFKFPGGAGTNYIKRLVGSPRETIRIRGGDIYVKPTGAGDDQYAIARKRPGKLLAMLQPVFDNRVMPKIVEMGWPSRWKATPPEGPGAWLTEDHLSYHTDGTAQGDTWFRYRHRVPTREQWYQLEHGVEPSAIDVRTQLISDCSAYNTRTLAKDRGRSESDSLGLHWVGDLAVECTVEVESDSGLVLLELVEGGHQMQCRIDVATGKATLAVLSPDGGMDFQPQAETDIRGPGTYDLRFSSCDDELRLWVDGSVIEFDGATTYEHLDTSRPTDADLAPVGIGSEGAALRVGNLKILRDIYYIAARAGNLLVTDHVRPGLFSQAALYEPSVYARNELKTAEFVLEADQFLALGDNSARSLDGRLWPGNAPPYGADPLPYYVSRELLIGKALYIYWPHSWDKLPGTNIPFPFFPNFPRMGFVR